MKKRGAYKLTKETYMMFPRYFIIILIVVVVAMILTVYVTREVKLYNLDSYLLDQRVIYSEHCLAYNDGVRTYPGIIDSTKFTDSRISNCLIYPSGQGQGAVLTLYSLEQDANGYFKPLNQNNKISFNKWLSDLTPTCTFSNQYQQSSLKIIKKNFECYRYIDYVIFKEGQTETPAILEIIIINKNE